MAAAAAAADSVKRIKAEATCSICLELLRDPVTTACGHSFCKVCIDRLCQGREDAACPQCRQPLQKGTVQPNHELRSIVALFRSQAKEKPAAGTTCERHQEPLKLYCSEDQTPICLVCRESKDHQGHKVAPLGEAIEEYRGKMKEQRGIIESSCGKLHQFVSEIWEHLSQNEQDEECQNLAGVCEKLTGLQVRTGTPEERSENKDSKPKDSPPKSDSSESESDRTGREPGSEPAAETREETGSRVSPVSEEASTPKEGLDQASLDQLIHKISDTTGAAQSKESIRQQLEGIESECEKLNQFVSMDQTDLSQNAREAACQSVKRLTDNIATLLKVAVQETRKRPKEGSSTTPAEGSGGSRTGAIPASSEQEGAAKSSGTEAAREGQQHPGSKKSKNKKRKNKKHR